MYEDIKCPYCGHGQEINHDDGYGYDEGEAHNQDCYECEKTFIFYTQISFDYDAHKAPCLNDGEHDWKAVRGYESYYEAPVRCSVCAKLKLGKRLDKERE